MKLPAPRQMAEYRSQTFEDRVPGISYVRFRCKKCRLSKSTGGSKKNTPWGWICKECKDNLITGESK